MVKEPPQRSGSVPSATSTRRWPTDRTTSDRMKRVRRASTAPELRVRRAALAAGIRFRFTVRTVVGTPDLCNKRRKLAIFVHGCFWHGHEGCSRATLPARNRALWATKIAQNRTRDRRVVRILRASGYAVLAIWECETQQIGVVAARIKRFSARAGSRGSAKALDAEMTISIM